MVIELRQPKIKGKFSVYHLNCSTEGARRQQCRFSDLSVTSKVNLAALAWNACLSPEDEDLLGMKYDKVAEIEFEFERSAQNCNRELEECFELTNSNGYSWTEGVDVITKGMISENHPMRSTSVGDIIVAYGGQSYLVDSTGFLMLPLERFFRR